MQNVLHTQLLDENVLADVAEPVALRQLRHVVATLVDGCVAAVAEENHVAVGAVPVATHLADGVIVVLVLLLPSQLRPLRQSVVLKLLLEPLALIHQSQRFIARGLRSGQLHHQVAQRLVVLTHQLVELLLRLLQRPLHLVAVHELRLLRVRRQRHVHQLQRRRHLLRLLALERQLHEVRNVVVEVHAARDAERLETATQVAGVGMVFVPCL